MNTGIYFTCLLYTSFCDTQHEEGKMMTDDEIIAEVKYIPVFMTGMGRSLPDLIFPICSDVYKRQPKWRLSLQTHKLIDIR